MAGDSTLDSENGEPTDESNVAEHNELRPSRLCLLLLVPRNGEPGDNRSLNPDMLQCFRLFRAR